MDMVALTPLLKLLHPSPFKAAATSAVTAACSSRFEEAEAEAALECLVSGFGFAFTFTPEKAKQAKARR
jgi:hypothetical protein